MNLVTLGLEGTDKFGITLGDMPSSVNNENRWLSFVGHGEIDVLKDKMKGWKIQECYQQLSVLGSLYIL